MQTNSTNFTRIISVQWYTVISKLRSYPGTAFLRKTLNSSARIIKKRVKDLFKIFSISSLCLSFIDTLTELMLVSIRVYSFSFLATRIGFKMTSLLVWISTSGLI
eukprot:NODE_305_length_11349_cov_0.358222.p11 type:complete len:105 gc:universal NODE_305_length_11349_cov_0.358222:10763-11077(+)